MPTSEAGLARALRAARETAFEAGRLLVERQGAAAVSRKGEINLVTEADMESEALCRGRLTAAVPGSVFLGEEEGGADPRGDLVWVVDPLDGTNNYAHGLPVFAVSIALCHRGEALVGVVHAPCLDEMFSAAKGRGAQLNGRDIRVSSEDRLGRSMLATGFPYDIRTNKEANNLGYFSVFSKEALGIRRFGSASIDLAWVAMGRFDGYWELGLSIWDIAAGALIVREAGGTVSDFHGGPVPNPPAEILATNARIHEAMRCVLEGNTAGG
ncbi:MAG: inositol monophosphatase [Deltaproteobacteria bacterium]|nr:inositol monophosphatase [Deltaproteobacteria bacterium]